LDKRTPQIDEMKTDYLKDLLLECGENVKFDYDLKKRTWFNIGGKTKIFYKAENLKELVNFLKKINNKEKIFVLGAGSNTLISDNFFNGIVIKLGKTFNNISLLGEDVVIAGSAVLDKTLSDFAINNSLSGFEFLSGIPGTVGGGIKMNAGCFGSEFKDILISIQAIDKLGNIITIPKKDINFEYRKNNLPEDLIFLSASFKGKKAEKKDIQKETIRLKKEKEKNQPTKIKTSGSTFKNPISQTNKKVWQLINESVPLNKSFGDACISEKHCNFFVNKGNATFKDMNDLINFVADNVYRKTGIKLEKEIKTLE
jgi:UDP-N-acetylmuramate dehydrogenase